jgi:hypothetical protein
MTGAVGAGTVGAGNPSGTANQRTSETAGAGCTRQPSPFAHLHARASGPVWRLNCVISKPYKRRLTCLWPVVSLLPVTYHRVVPLNNIHAP